MVLLIFLVTLITLNYIEGQHTPHLDKFFLVLNWAGWWVLLGIASSVGLGTGLHTFVLYLGPHIASVTMASYKCGHVPTFLPNRF